MEWFSRLCWLATREVEPVEKAYLHDDIQTQADCNLKMLPRCIFTKIGLCCMVGVFFLVSNLCTYNFPLIKCGARRVFCLNKTVGLVCARGIFLVVCYIVSFNMQVGSLHH